MKKRNLLINSFVLWGCMLFVLPNFLVQAQAQVKPPLAAPACSGYYGKLNATNWPAGATATVTCQGAGRQRGKCVGNSAKIAPGQSYGFGNCNCLDKSMPCFAVSGLPPGCKWSSAPVCAANTNVISEDVIVTCSAPLPPPAPKPAPVIPICPASAASTTTVLAPASLAQPAPQQQVATSNAIQFQQQSPKSTLQLNYFNIPIPQPKPFVPAFTPKAVPPAPPAGTCVTVPNPACTAMNWTGYTDKIPANTQQAFVSSDWVVASMDCTNTTGNPYELTQWVGIDGSYDPKNGILAQLGSYNFCNNGKEADRAFTEQIPADPILLPVTNPVNPGDHMTASVTMTSPGVFSTKMQNITQGWSYQLDMNYNPTNLTLSNREIILENETVYDQNNQETLPSTLVKFQPVPFFNNSLGLNNQTPQPLTWGGPDVACLNGTDVISKPNVTNTEPSTLMNNGDFLITWLQ